MKPAPSVLEQLIRPECDGRTRCHAPATYIASVHQVDCCIKNPQPLTPDGDTILLLCQECLAATAALITRDLHRKTSRTPHTRVVACLTCGRPVARLHDVLQTELL